VRFDEVVSDASNQTVGTGKAAERIGVSPETIRRWADEGLIPSWRTPKGTRRIPVTALDALTMTPAVPA
jgi:excisionase family DNA binding protein